MKKAIAVGVLLLLPSLALGAGFARQSIFLSKPSVTEGEVVLVHAVVQNQASTTFPGNVVITDEGEKIGSVPVTLKAGEAQTVSVSWKPAAGSRTIVAELQDKAGTAIESESETFSIQAKPKPAQAKSQGISQSAAAVESSADIQAKIGDISPAAGSTLEPVFKLVDGSRTAIADVLDSQIAATKPKLAPTPGVVAGTSTIQAPEQGSWFSSIFNTVYFYILTVLRYLIGSAGIFYPLLAAVFLFTLWRMFRRFRRG